MTTSLIVGERPLPVVLPPARDELLSSWLRRHVAFYGVTEPMFASWLRLGTNNLRSLDGRLGLGQVARIVEKFRCDPSAVLEMTHAPLPAEFAPLVRSSRPSQFCRSCWDQHLAADAQGVVMKSWREGWRVTCPVCDSPLSEGDRPRRSDDTVRDTSPFSKDWDAATERRRHRQSAFEGRAYSARLPHCDDAALTDPELAPSGNVVRALS